ncbi:sensor histidine kinase [Halovenus sp. WSH3]|uniref:histidine kinase n=1 Tax=Halovenus carboxidivorans TaxID=2692199 RepID=A0A6B0T5B2_9EURY|nr:HAMP domain-containing sensor histidine kinase [Halovenus carboxidivorans]MXR52147.1 sensor histidine kinase [Halovenus carboxidivorans]
MNWRSLSPWGLVIALLGFVLTRMTVTLAAQESTRQFLFAGIVPLVLGLSLTAFGVILTVGAYDQTLLRRTALWSIAGTGGMAVLVVLTALGTQSDVSTMAEFRQQTYLSNFLIGGAVGGTLTGLYAARNRRHRRDLKRQANRLILLNRLLRDKVINSATAIKGHASVLADGDRTESIDVIDGQTDDIIETVENVKYLSETADRSDRSLGAVDVIDCLDSEIDAVRDLAPEAEITVETPAEDVLVRANAQLAEVFRQLLLNAVEYADENAPRVDASVDLAPNHVTVHISDTGPGLPADQRALLERGEIAEFDDPTTGFGLNIVRLLVESFDGQITTTVDSSGTTVSLRLPREGATLGTSSPGATATTAGVAPSRVALAVGASLVAGAVMALAMLVVGGDVPVIGALYGVDNLIVATISHEFHSVVFGLVYAGLLSALPAESSRRLRHQMGIAVGFSLALWLVAAGVVMPLWLRALGLDATVPMLSAPSLLGHLLWGLSLSALYFYGDRWLADSDPSASASLFERLSRVPEN